MRRIGMARVLGDVLRGCQAARPAISTYIFSGLSSPCTTAY
jgi:hypothetical protein